MDNADFTKQVSEELAADIAARKLRLLIVQEYADMAVAQEMQRQRPAIDLWAERSFTNHDMTEDQRLDDPRHGQAKSINQGRF